MFPASGSCETTRPFETRDENTRRTRPSEHPASWSADLARASVFRTIGGTTHCTSNVATGQRSASIVTAHTPLPAHPLLHPTNLEPGAAAALSVTDVPCPTTVVQAGPQSIPLGLLVTWPKPEPAFVTVSVCTGVVANVALTETLPSSLTRHASAPEQAPLQLKNRLCGPSGRADNSMVVPSGSRTLQLGGHATLAGTLATFPAPLTDTVSWCP